MKIYDAHCHIYPDGLGRKAVWAVDSFYGGLPSEHYDGTTGALISSGSERGITHFIVHSVATKPSQVSTINRFLSNAMGASGGSFTALGTMHVDAENVEKDFEELLALGLRGVKLHPDIQKFQADSPKAMRIYEMCEAKKVPVLVHTGDHRYDYSNPPRIARVLRAFPDLLFVGAHFSGWSVWEEAARTLADFPNLYVDTCSSFYWLKHEKARALIRTYGSERVMFGTDYPFWPQDWEIDYLRKLDLTQEEYENIFWRSCARRYGVQQSETEGQYS